MEQKSAQDDASRIRILLSGEQQQPRARTQPESLNAIGNIVIFNYRQVPEALKVCLL